MIKFGCHEGFLPVHFHMMEESFLAVAMEYCPGGSLKKFTLRENLGTLTERVKLYLFRI